MGVSCCRRLLLPGLQGLVRQEAESRLAAADLTTEVRELPAQQPPGRVSAQLPLPGVEVARRTRVLVDVALAVAQRSSRRR